MKFDIYIDEERSKIIIVKEQAYSTTEYDIHGTTSVKDAAELIKVIEREEGE